MICLGMFLFITFPPGEPVLGASKAQPLGAVRTVPQRFKVHDPGLSSSSESSDQFSFSSSKWTQRSTEYVHSSTIQYLPLCCQIPHFIYHIYYINQWISFPSGICVTLLFWFIAVQLNIVTENFHQHANNLAFICHSAADNVVSFCTTSSTASYNSSFLYTCLPNEQAFRRDNNWLRFSTIRPTSSSSR